MAGKTQSVDTAIPQRLQNELQQHRGEGSANGDAIASERRAKPHGQRAVAGPLRFASPVLMGSDHRISS
jgi:hypothetical protein